MHRRRSMILVGVYVALAIAAGGAIAASEGAPSSPSDAARSVAEPPEWPIGFRLPEELTVGWKRRESMYKSPKAHVLVWTPPAAKRIRAAFLIPNNTDSKHVGEHAAVRAVAAKHEIGIVYLRNLDGGVVERTDPPEDAERIFAAVLNLVAGESDPVGIVAPISRRYKF